MARGERRAREKERLTAVRSFLRSFIRAPGLPPPMMIRSYVVRGGLERREGKGVRGGEKGPQINWRSQAASNLFDCFVIDVFNRGHLSPSIAALESSAASEPKRVAPTAHFSGAVQKSRIMYTYAYVRVHRRNAHFSALAYGFQKWNAPSLCSLLSPPQYMLGAAAITTADGHCV